MPSNPEDDEILIFEEDHTNRLGDRVARNYRWASNKKPGGDCFDVSHRRVQKASREVCALTLPDISRDTNFGKLWGSLSGAVEGNYDEQVAWQMLPIEYRGLGAPGAMAYIGRGTLVTQSEIWRGAGKLKPGAVIQVWRLWEDLDRVAVGLAPLDIGHSFVFLKYVRVGSLITGMKVADQGFFSVGETVKEADWGFWVGANIFCG